MIILKACLCIAAARCSVRLMANNVSLREALRGWRAGRRNLGVPHPSLDAAGAFRRATCAQIEAHVICGVYSTPGPLSVAGYGRGQSAPDGDSHLVVPGGAPMRRPKAFLGRAEIVMLWAAGRLPPECLAAYQARRRRTPSRHNERLYRLVG